MMGIVGRGEQLNDPIFLLGRVIVRTARGYSSEASEVCDTFENTMRQAGLRRQNP